MWLNITLNRTSKYLKTVSQKRLKHDWIQPSGYDTGIKIYNLVTKTNVPLIVSNRHLVKWYICGPTVYDSAHIGHARCYVHLDVLRRILENHFNLNLVVALGITDIDDKIINRSNQLNTDFKTFAKKYELEFLKDLNNLNISLPHFLLRVSEHIPEIIEFINSILKKKLAYVTQDGSVYFKTNEFQFSNKFINTVPNLNQDSNLHEGQLSSSDFALWKAYKPNEPFWEAPWGKGRPGWHIECSTMASKLFGKQLDLHSGGLDLIFPHHDCEETQSCAYHDCEQWVNYWIHTGHLTVEDTKMSKSLGNFVTISQFLEEYSSDNLRMLCMLTNYRHGFEYNKGLIKHSKSMCEKFSSFLDSATNYIKGHSQRGNVSETELLKVLDDTSKDITRLLADNFNTPECIKALDTLVHLTKRMMNETSTETASRSPAAIASVAEFINRFFDSVGFRFGRGSEVSTAQSDEKFNFLLEQMIQFRTQVRKTAATSKEKSVKQNLFNACDSVRSEVSTIGITLSDEKSASANRS